MSSPVNIYCPCNGDAYKPIFQYYADLPSCNFCIREGEKCLGNSGWPFWLVGAEVARERLVNAAVDRMESIMDMLDDAAAAEVARERGE